jgi:hypothetical protein
MVRIAASGRPIEPLARLYRDRCRNGTAAEPVIADLSDREQAAGLVEHAEAIVGPLTRCSPRTAAGNARARPRTCRVDLLACRPRRQRLQHPVPPARVKRLDPAPPLFGGEWISGPYALLSSVSALAETMGALASGNDPLAGYAIGAAPAWGAFPGHPLTDIQSGRGNRAQRARAQGHTAPNCRHARIRRTRRTLTKGTNLGGGPSRPERDASFSSASIVSLRPSRPRGALAERQSTSAPTREAAAERVTPAPTREQVS